MDSITSNICYLTPKYMKHALILEDGEPLSEDDNKPGNQVLADVEKKSYNVTVVKIKVYSTA